MAAQLPDKQTAYCIATMVECGLLRHDHFIPWADELVMSVDSPPGWVLELCTTLSEEKAAGILLEYAASPPFEPLGRSDRGENAVASYLLRYQGGDLSWASFLGKAGDALDICQGRVECEYLFEMLNELERVDCSKDLERMQRAEVERTFKVTLARIEPLYASFASYAQRAQAR